MREVSETGDDSIFVRSRCQIIVYRLSRVALSLCLSLSPASLPPSLPPHLPTYD